jgi:choline-sulfatase
MRRRRFYPDLLRGARLPHRPLSANGTRKLPKGGEPTDALRRIRGHSAAILTTRKMPDGTLRHETDLIVDRGIEFLKAQQSKDQPFALQPLVQRLPRRRQRPPTRHRPISPGPNPPMASTTTSRDVPSHASTIPPSFNALPDFLQDFSMSRERYFWALEHARKSTRSNMPAPTLRHGHGHRQREIGRFLEALEKPRAWPTTPSSSIPPTTATTSANRGL